MLLLVSPLRALTFGEVDFNYKSKTIICIDALLMVMVLAGFVVLNIGGGQLLATFFLSYSPAFYNQFRIVTGYIIPYLFLFGLGIHMILPLLLENSFMNALQHSEPHWIAQIREYIKSVFKFCATALFAFGFVELLPAGFAFWKQYILSQFTVTFVFILLATYLLRSINLTKVHRIWLALVGCILVFFVAQRASEHIFTGEVFKIDFRKECI